MTRLTKRVPSQPAQLARDEATAAWHHLVAAAEHGARRFNDTSRMSRKVARERATYAARALRGERPPSPWRWLGIGLAAGAVAGAVAGVVLSRRPDLIDRDEAEEQARQTAAAVREKASTAVETIRDRTSAAAQRAASTARETAAKVREAAARNDKGNGAADSDQSVRDPESPTTVK